MNKIFLVATLFSLGGIMGLQAQTQHYRISGAASDLVNGDTIYIQEVVRNRPVNPPIAQALVKDGRFTFEGNVNHSVPKVLFLVSPVEGKQMFTEFFLEPGEITANLNLENTSITGTPQNDSYQQVRNKVTALRSKLMDVYRQMNSKDLTAEEDARHRQTMLALENEFKTLMKDEAAKQIQTPVGVFIFTQIYRDYSPAVADSLFRLIPPVILESDKDLVEIGNSIQRSLLSTVGSPYLNLSMHNLEDQPVELAQYIGKSKLLLVDFWASWCGPCRKAMPKLIALYEEYKDKGLEIVGVSFDEKADSWKQAVEALKLPWPQMSDLKGWKSEAAKLYDITGIPALILIDQQGTIIAKDLHGEALKKKIEELLQP